LPAEKNEYEINEDIAIKLRKYFAKSNQETFVNIKHALEQGNTDAAHRSVHTLKSSAGQIGEKMLQKAASDVEKMFENDEVHLSDEKFSVLDAELKRTLDKLSPLLVSDEAMPGNDLFNIDETKNIFDQLEPLLRRKDVKCLKLLDDIYRIPGAADLALSIENHDFKTALLKLENLKPFYSD